MNLLVEFYTLLQSPIRYLKKLQPLIKKMYSAVCLICHTYPSKGGLKSFPLGHRSNYGHQSVPFSNKGLIGQTDWIELTGTKNQEKYLITLNGFCCLLDTRFLLLQKELNPNFPYWSIFEMTSPCCICISSNSLKCRSNILGSFNNYVDRILPIFWLPPPLAWTVFIPWAWTKTAIFWPPPPLILST